MNDGFCLTTCFLTTSLLVRTVWTVSDAIAVPGWLQTFSAAGTPTKRFGKEKSAHIRFGNHSVRVLDGQGEYRMDLRNLFECKHQWTRSILFLFVFSSHTESDIKFKGFWQNRACHAIGSGPTRMLPE